MKKIITFTGLVLLAFTAFTIMGSTETQIYERLINLDEDEMFLVGEEYLSTFDQNELEVSESDIRFTGIKHVTELYNVELLSTDNLDYNDLEVMFDILYVKTLNIFFIDLILLDYEGEVIDQIEMTAYPEVNEENQLDISFDYAGYYFHASNIIDGSNSEMVGGASSQFFFEIMDDGGGGGTFYPIINVTYSVIGIDNAESASQDIMDPITLLDDGPVKYIYHHAKLSMIRDNYEHNSSLIHPTGMIDDQNSSVYLDWEFGLSDLNYAGCEIIAMYNFLYNNAGVGDDPDLPTLIALTQLIYADMGLGFLGSAATDDNLIGLVENEVLDAMQYLYDEYVTSQFIRDVAEAIVDFYYSIPGWMQSFFEFVISNTVDALISSINPLLGATEPILDAVLGQGHHFSRVLELYQVSNSDIHYNLSTYNDSLDESRDFIITYYNDPDYINGVVPSFWEMIHTVYIYRDYDSNGFDAYNHNYSNRDDLYDFIDSDLSNAENMFISGIIIKD